MSEQRYSMILTTTGSRTEAEQLARSLVEHKLAACVQVLDITSFYTWEGTLEQAPEHLLLIKTVQQHYPQIEAFLQEHHSYDVPEIVQVPIQQGLAAYLHWIDESTT